MKNWNFQCALPMVSNEPAINTVGDLIEKTREEMSKIRNLGQKSLEEIEKKLKELDLTFKKSDE